MKIRFLTIADQEVDEAVAWHNQQVERLGREFLDDHVVLLTTAYPRLGTEIEPEIRRFLFTRFPYSLIYGIDDETIVVLAVAHQHREPRYWIERIDDI